MNNEKLFLNIGISIVLIRIVDQSFRGLFCVLQSLFDSKTRFASADSFLVCLTNIQRVMGSCGTCSVKIYATLHRHGGVYESL